MSPHPHPELRTAGDSVLEVEGGGHSSVTGEGLERDRRWVPAVDEDHRGRADRPPRLQRSRAGNGSGRSTTGPRMSCRCSRRPTGGHHRAAGRGGRRSPSRRVRRASARGRAPCRPLATGDLSSVGSPAPCRDRALPGVPGVGADRSCPGAFHRVAGSRARITVPPQLPHRKAAVHRARGTNGTIGGTD